LDEEQLRQRALDVHERLIGMYGEPGWRSSLDPVGQLMSTILSQNTNDVNRDRAFRRLRERFPSWEAVRDADLEAIKDAIRVSGLANLKGPAIQRALKHITEERGELSLDFLRDLPLEEAKSWLTEIKGVGPKTAAIVLLFALGRPAFPVDTHVHRVTRRLGLIGPKVSREQAQVVLEDLLPEELYYVFHLNLIRHGREVCIAGNPHCEVCALQEVCDYYQRQVAGG
jgi:endonuclease-3